MKISKKRGLWKIFGPILGFYTKNSPRNSWSSHFMITLWNQKSRNVRTPCTYFWQSQINRVWEYQRLNFIQVIQGFIWTLFYLVAPSTSDFFLYWCNLNRLYCMKSWHCQKDRNRRRFFFYVEKGLCSHSLPKFDIFIAMIAMHKSNKKLCPPLHLQLLGEIYLLFQGFWLHIMYIHKFGPCYA